MAFERPIRDIARGDIWIDRHDGARVIIVTAGNRYVELMRGRDRIEIFYEPHFRARFEALYDRPALRSQFSMSLANLGAFHAFFSPTLKRMFARSSAAPASEVRGAARGRPALPPDAVHVGTYAEPVTPDTFLRDLDDAGRQGAI